MTPIIKRRYADLDFARIVDFFKHNQINKIDISGWKGDKIKRFLKNKEVLVEYQGKLCPTVAGALLFGKKPSSLLGYSGITVTKFADTERDYNYVDFRLDKPIMNTFSEHGGKEEPGLIDKALEMSGFNQDKKIKTVTVGYGRNTVLSLKEEIVEAVMKGHINSFFLVAGCDGAKPGRNYYTEFAEKAPKDSVILTLACGKFRFFDKDLGEIDGIPRLLDIGQCNDAYSAIKIAQAFAEVFQSDISGLPLFFILSWYEQKAVAILLSLFYLGIKNIRLGPSLPAFITPNVLNVLVEKFNIMTLKTPDEDIKTIIDYVNGVDT